jgi:acyl dehydratase
MIEPKFAGVKVDDELPALTMPPVTRLTLAIYCGASGDHNPIHVDLDFARESGLDDVIAHGMLVMAYLGRLLTSWVGQDAIRSFDTRFQAMTQVGDAITASGRVVEKFTDGDKNCVRIDLAASNQSGELKASGTAVVTLNE